MFTSGCGLSSRTPCDEFLLELAVAGRADAIVTHNVRHFVGAEQFGIRVMTPREFLRTIEGEGI
jgi:predicted nucleic acid-binding protein